MIASRPPAALYPRLVTPKVPFSLLEGALLFDHPNVRCLLGDLSTEVGVVWRVSGEGKIGATLLTSSASQTPYGDVLLADVDLFKMLSERNECVITCLFDRYSRLVYSTALRVLHDPAAAEDVMQELFLNLWRRPPAMIPTSGGLAGWFVVLSRNRAISLLRKRKHVVPMNELTIASPHDLSREAEKTLLFNRVCGLMTVLPSEQQKVLKLAFFEGLTHPEIANITGHALGTVKTRIRTALRTLHKDLARKHERTRDEEGLAARLHETRWKPVPA